jgi:competence protein ComEA
MFRLFLSFVAAIALIAVQPHVASASQQKGGARPAAKAAVNGSININTAPASDLEALPGIGAKTAARIIEYRQKNGPFKKIEELMNVRGVGEKNFLKLKSQITVATAKADQQPQ